VNEDIRKDVDMIWRNEQTEEDLLKVVKLDVGFVNKGETLLDNREGRQKQYLYHPERITQALVTELEGLSEDEHIQRLLDAGVLTKV
jgi:hypothetical protein